MDVLQGLVTINPRYSPKLIQERALESPAATLKTMVCCLCMLGQQLLQARTCNLGTGFRTPLSCFTPKMVLQARVVEIVGSVGLFFAKLKVDDITGRSDDMEQVRTRAAEAR